MALPENINPVALAALGTSLGTKFTEYENDRKDLELKWLKNRRQFRGEYDPEIKLLLKPDRSKVYPKITRSKVIGMVARLMDLLFPQTAKNWNISPTPFPDIAQTDLQNIINQLQQAVQGGQLTDDMIEQAVDEFAEKRCLRMEKTIEDQMANSKLDYITLVRKVVFSSVVYGCGVLKGPLVRRSQKRTWIRNAVSGQYEAQTVPSLEPYYEFVPVWGFYPDLTAKERDQMDGAFERHIYNRHELRKLANRPDFFGDIIKDYINANPKGNFKEKEFESEFRAEKNNTDNTVNRSGKKYEVLEWWGFVSGQELKNIGLPIDDKDLADDLAANVWVLDNKTIKATLAPMPPDVKMYHLFVYEEDDNFLLGSGMPEVLRESQLAVCASARMVLDNGSVVCGPVFEVNTEVLGPNTTTDIHAFKVFEREGTGQDAGIQAVKQIQVDAHIPELLNIVELFKSFADTESLLPPSLQGDMTAQGKEPFRTQGNTSQLLGAAALPIRDVVRNFDQFTESVIGSLYYWNMTFNPDPEIKGDYQVQALGSTSLIAKEVRAQALDNLSTTLTPEDRSWIDDEEFLRERLLARDLPVDKLVLSEDKHMAKLQEQSAAQMGAAQAQQALANAQVKDTLSHALLNVAQAEASAASVPIQQNEQVLSAIETATTAAQAAHDMSQPQGAPSGQ